MSMTWSILPVVNDITASNVEGKISYTKSRCNVTFMNRINQEMYELRYLEVYLSHCCETKTYSIAKC